MTNIILANDHETIRQGLRTLLEAEPDFQIVGEAGDGLETTRLVERLQPDVLVIDLAMLGLNGLEVTRQVSQRSPRTRVIIFSLQNKEAYVMEALRRGAADYVFKAARVAELVQAIREVAAGRRYLSPPLSKPTIEAYRQKVQEATLDAHQMLTPREPEVLHLVAKGYPNAEIAARLSISPSTVKTHLANVRRKLDLPTQADLIRYAQQPGILPPED